MHLRLQESNRVDRGSKEREASDGEQQARDAISQAGPPTRT